MNYRCFVYGTLRPGDYNHERVGGQIGDAVPAIVEGDLFHLEGCSSEHPAYPVAKFDGSGTIHGEIVVLDEEVWRRICRMEIGAGYLPQLVRAQPIVRDEDEGFHIDLGDPEWVFGWHYIGDRVGPQIKSGDWFYESEH